jgi:hypothetical protein
MEVEQLLFIWSKLPEVNWESSRILLKLFFSLKVLRSSNDIYSSVS